MNCITVFQEQRGAGNLTKAQMICAKVQIICAKIQMNLCLAQVGVRWGGQRPPPNGASFLLGACRGGRIWIQGFSVRSSVRSENVIFYDFYLINVMVFWYFFYAAFRFSPKRVILTILGPKVRKWVISRTFSPQNAFLRLFRSKTPKTGMGREPCSSQCFFSYFGSHLRKKAPKGRF